MVNGMTKEMELEKKEEEGLNLADYGFMFLSHWYWFVASVVVAMVIAVYYIMSTTPIYTTSTQLLIRDDKNSKGASTSIQDFSDLSLIKSNTNIKNEILTISAPIMMQETAKRLHLDLQMDVEQGLHRHPLYNDAPIVLDMSMPLGDDNSFAFELTPLSRSKVEISSFEMMGEKVADGKKLMVNVGQRVKTPVGGLMVSLSPAWDDSFIGKKIYVNKYPITAVGNAYAARLNVALSDKEASVLDLSISDESPDRAKDVLLTLIDVYNEKWVKDKNRMAESTSEFIEERLTNLTKELENVDEKISDYKSVNLLPDIQASLAKDMQQSGKNFDELLKLHNQLSMAKFLRERLDDKSKDDQLLPSNVGISAGGVESLVAEYNKLMLDRISYVENSSVNAPVVKDIDRRLSSQKMAIVRSLDNYVAQIQKQIDNVRASDEQINAQIASNPRQAKVLTSVQRQQTVKEALYIFLLQKREENELSRTYTAWNTSIIQPPTASRIPAAPKKNMIMLMAFVLGLVVPGGLLFLRDTMNHTVRGRKDLDSLGVPLVGEVPDISIRKHWWSRRSPVKREVVVKADSRDLINESLRIVRTNLDYFIKNHNAGNVVMFTSFNPGSGKSFITPNLAKAIALRDKRVITIDMDLRHASLSHMVARRSPVGLSSYLGGQETDIDSLIVKDGIAEGVDLIPVGVIPPNPAELLQMGDMKTLIEKLRQEYDFIFLDCPPIEIVADASIIKDYADVTIFVVRAGLMDRRALGHVSELYKEKKFNNLTLLLNGTKYVSGKYGNYRYGYGYGYGCGNSYYSKG